MITDFQFSSKLTGLPELVLGGLQELRKEYITDSDGPEKTVRVLKKEKKKMIRSHKVMAYINSACERSQSLLASYFPFDMDDSRYERQVTLTLKVTIKPLLANTDAATKIYVDIDEDFY
ncbi:hypothetical protein ALT_6200 [Aspergillus lentulus]|uniref:Uncharacterized protein n=1 Tax=Aspergillus lentulus TaxID=293939 RepID=A0AAN4PMX6_ASPLE|nr:hypothetical protein CNMCM6069_002721 [Aspergillus lentulus]KAF4171696.1 hypothetical protein CNMCM8060_002558 [Aspergillus lentulus]KAF4191224.1 hypothetical protein CNMCM8694_002121 [Aspergillus lentulus]GAQ08879.1 hypothetical protein ALT_6200 [Aspergillus lentulus]GFF44616.1 hypothetical protein IFM62136_00038 [Aspergillus lentulus]